MFITNCGEKKLVKHEKVSKYYDQDCSNKNITIPKWNRSSAATVCPKNKSRQVNFQLKLYQRQLLTSLRSIFRRFPDLYKDIPAKVFSIFI